MIIFPELIDENLQISQVTVANEITITLRTTLPTATCPCCGTISKRVQSRYRRTLHDLPMSGRLVRLIVEVRRFFCKNPTCARKIFAELLPALCRPHAQRTKRLQEALCRLGLAVGGQAGEDIGSEQGMSGSRDTILRLVRKSELSTSKEPKIIGLDDWAWKRRRRYGTLICDLESRNPIDLLPDRRAETVSAWLQAHPHIDMVSRDGSSEYASAIKKGAPQARQVSDRWHLTKNLAECVSVQMAQSLGKLRRTELTQAKTAAEEKRRDEQQHPVQIQAMPPAQLVRQVERGTRYEQMMMLREQGLKNTDIAAQMGITARTVQRWIASGDIPYSRPRKPRSHLIDPYKAYLFERWHQGCHNGLRLERELRAKGYKGSQKGVYRYLETLEPSASPKVSRPSASAIPPNPLLTLSAQQATWLFFRKEKDLKVEEQESLRQLRQASPEIETVFQLVEKFLRMVRERTGEQLDTWLNEVKDSHLEAFDSFVTGVQQDKEAVFAGLTLSWSNGPLEGHVNRLKLLKRSMYGRAEFDLLKLRVLHRSKKNQDRKDKKKNHQKQQVSRLKKPKMMKSSRNSHHTTFFISEVA